VTPHNNVARLQPPHTCQPPRVGFWAFVTGKFERGTLWDCQCGLQYLYDPQHMQSGTHVHVPAAHHWPWISTWPYRYEPREDGRFRKKQVSWPPGYRTTDADLEGRIVTSWS
jgi:hypothetical protein